MHDKWLFTITPAVSLVFEIKTFLPMDTITSSTNVMIINMLEAWTPFVPDAVQQILADVR